jgi:hypothetical protein
MSVIGDTEPEDEYDASDRLEERLRVIARIIEAYRTTTDPTRRAMRHDTIVRLLDAVDDHLTDLADRSLILRAQVT